MPTHIYELDIEKQEIVIIISEKSNINRDGWIFPCIFCTLKTYNIEVIEDSDGMVKSFVCKYCKYKKIDTKYNFEYYYNLLLK